VFGFGDRDLWLGSWIFELFWLFTVQVFLALAMVTNLRLISHVTALPDKQIDARRLLLELADASLAEEDCVSYDVLQSLADPNEFVLLSVWRTEEALADYLKSAPVDQAYRDGLGVIADAPEVLRYQVVKSD
jgi:quinol monooxygenase YgiN